MKNAKIYLVLLTGTLSIIGATTLTTKLAAADGDVSAGGMSCCSGMNMSAPSPVASTNAVPDLLTTCPVSGEKLGEMGNPLVFTYKDQEVKLCCKGCKKDFDKSPEKFLKIIRAADAAKK